MINVQGTVSTVADTGGLGGQVTSIQAKTGGGGGTLLPAAYYDRPLDSKQCLPRLSVILNPVGRPVDLYGFSIIHSSNHGQYCHHVHRMDQHPWYRAKRILEPKQRDHSHIKAPPISFGDTLYACAIIDLAEAAAHLHMTHYSITVMFIMLVLYLKYY